MKFISPFRIAFAEILISCFLAIAVHSQSTVAHLASVKGVVTDSRGVPVAGAIMHLLAKDSTEKISRTDEKGAFSFASLPPGDYRLRAQLAGSGGSATDSFYLQSSATKIVNLKLLNAETKTRFDLYDSPQFTIAGVSDASNLGSHGSNVMSNKTELLAKKTVSLGAGSSRPAASNPDLIPAFKHAAEVDSSNYETRYRLAMAYFDAGQYEDASVNANILLQKYDRPELHHLLGRIDEKTNLPLQSVREFEQAAKLDPSESNLFDWGAELLLHRATAPAVTVFKDGVARYPKSLRTLMGLAAALSAQGFYEEAMQRLCEASDLDVADPNPYLFMGEILTGLPAVNREVSDRFRRFATLEPQNAQANYLYALSILKRRKSVQETSDTDRAEALFKKAVLLDPSYGNAYLQLGIIDSERGDIAGSIRLCAKAAAISPELPEPHYRLAQAYARAGQKLKAEEQLRLFNEAKKDEDAKLKAERQSIQDFVLTPQNTTADSH